jgi:signal transduction histidine kinase
VSSLVTYAAPPRLKIRPIDFGGFFRDVLEQYGTEWRTRGTDAILSVEEPEGPLTVEIDSEQFSDAAGRIVQNALEALDGNGMVTAFILKGGSRYTPACSLTAELLAEMRGSSKLLDSRLPSAIVVIADNGCGMNEDDMGRLFVPFYTTKENGIGLGLAMARKTVEAHHGELWMASRKDAGSSVGIVLPCVSTVAGEPGV